MAGFKAARNSVAYYDLQAEHKTYPTTDYIAASGPNLSQPLYLPGDHLPSNAPSVLPIPHGGAKEPGSVLLSTKRVKES